MTKNYDEDLIEKGILQFSKTLHVLNKEKSIALVSCPYPGIKELDIDKGTKLKITIELINE